MPLMKKALQPAPEVGQQRAPAIAAEQTVAPRFAELKQEIKNDTQAAPRKLGAKKTADEQAAGVAQAAKEIAAVTTAAVATSVDGRHPGPYYQKGKFGERMTQFEIDLDERICRSGLYQAALQSSGVYSFSKAKNLKDYLTAVAEVADAAYEYVQRKR